MMQKKELLFLRELFIKTCLTIPLFLLLNTNEAFSQSWSAFPNGGMSDWVYSTMVYNGDLIVGGKFTSAGGVPANHIARWDGTSWYPLGEGVNGNVRALAEFNGNLVAAGEFTTAGGMAVNFIAQWDGFSWNNQLGGVGSTVTSLAVIGNTLYAGGYFTEADNTPVNYIAARNSGGWSALGSGMNGVEGQVMALTVFNGELYAGGFFNSAGGVNANHIAKWNGVSWSALGSGISGIVYALNSYNGNIIAGGLFLSAGGAPANHIASWDGASWSPLAGGMDGVFYQYVFTLEVYNGNLIAGGYFTITDGMQSNGIAEWDGAHWSTMGGGFFYPANVYGAHTMCIYGNDLIVGGLFSNAGGTGAAHIAKWNSPAPVIVQQNILIPQGWSGFSSYVHPDNPNVTDIFLPVQNEMVILYNQQGMYYPSQLVNTLGSFDNQSGYIAKFNQQTTLTITGTQLPNPSLVLNAGWNLIPVLSECPVGIEAFFENQDVTVVKEAAGPKMFWPQMGILTLSELLPGNSYYVLMNTSSVINFPNCASSIVECGSPFFDARDNQMYNTVQIGTQCWMSQNLNYGMQINGTEEMTNNGMVEKYCYNDDPTNCDLYGGLYQWKEMMQYFTNPGLKGICPAGWHLPTDEDWCVLEQRIDPTVICGDIGWRGTDAGINLQQGGLSGFEALIAGHRSASTGGFNSLGSVAYFWSSNAFDFSNIWSRNLNVGEGMVLRTQDYGLNGFSVRCVTYNCSSAPGAPATGAHASSPSQIIWNWNSSPTATGYKWSTINDYLTAEDLGSLTTKTENGLNCNTGYSRYVWAYNGCGYSLPLILTQSTSPCGGLPTVTTANITNIATVTATSGGNVTSQGGSGVTMRGVCWSTNPNPTTSNSKTIDGNGAGSFISYLTGLQADTKYFIRAYAINSAGTAYGTQLDFTTDPFFIGQNYGGGIIFYIDDTGQHGLISATTDQSTSAPWGCSGTLIGTSTTIGSGQANTNAIVNACTQQAIAARLCYDLVLNGYNDWFLPSKDELFLMYQEQELIGAVGIYTYWSSSEQGANFAYYKFFDDLNQFYTSKTTGYHVRAIRAF